MNNVSGYKSKSNLLDYNVFSPNYYTGCDVSIYFNNVWVDEINYIEYGIQEKVLPLYGYNDYVFRKVAKGNRIVQGRFRINFTEAGYLFSILNNIKNVSNIDYYSISKREGNIIDKKVLMNNMTFEDFTKYYETKIWNTSKSSVSTLNKPNLSDKNFDIIITYGPFNGSNPLKGLNTPRSTIRIIKDVVLIGCQQLVDSSDNPILEEYMFIGKDLINN